VPYADIIKDNNMIKKFRGMAVCLVFCVSMLYGGTVTWNSSTPGLWGDASNWNPQTVPSAEDSVTFEKNITLSISGITASAGTVTMEPPGLAGNLQLEGTSNSKLEVAGDFIQNNGSLTIRRLNKTTDANIRGSYNAVKGQLTILQKWNAPHLLAVDGSLNAGRKFTFRFALNGAKEFGAVLVKGSTDLGGSNLELYNLDGATCVESRLLLIQNDSPNVLVGTFGNAKFGSTVYTLNGHSYVLTLGDYDSGGVNNDVYLEKK
jgi:hypothetical protein